MRQAAWPRSSTATGSTSRAIASRSIRKVYTWWSYRAADWTVGDRGRRLDHIWVSKALQSHVQDFNILRDARGWERPSDHVPVTAVFEL